MGEGKIVGDPFFGHEAASFADRDKSAEGAGGSSEQCHSGGSEEVIIGDSLVMQQVFSTVEKLRDTDANILILGENGTGKDVIARLLYRNSPRYGKPFVTIDLGSIPEQLFESELFGYEKGAFTDARKAKAGRMEVATGGTLFLDEIGNLSLPMQANC